MARFPERLGDELKRLVADAEPSPLLRARAEHAIDDRRSRSRRVLVAIAACLILLVSVTTVRTLSSPEQGPTSAVGPPTSLSTDLRPPDGLVAIPPQPSAGTDVAATVRLLVVSDPSAAASIDGVITQLRSAGYVNVQGSTVVMDGRIESTVAFRPGFELVAHRVARTFNLNSDSVRSLDDFPVPGSDYADVVVVLQPFRSGPSA